CLHQSGDRRRARTGRRIHPRARSTLNAMPVAIRPYRDKDREAVAKLWLDSWRSTELSIARLATEAGNYDRIGRELAAGWQAHLAWDGDQLVGFLALKPATGCLDQLFVAPGAQGRGIGRQLLDLAKERLPRGL